jgi:hypothetical protein
VYWLRRRAGLATRSGACTAAVAVLIPCRSFCQPMLNLR